MAVSGSPIVSFITAGSASYRLTRRTRFSSLPSREAKGRSLRINCSAANFSSGGQAAESDENPYQVLGVNPFETFDKIKAVYAKRQKDAEKRGDETALSRDCRSQLKIFASSPNNPGQLSRKLRRRRHLSKEDSVSVTHRNEHYWDPHLERQVRRMKEQGNHINYDVERLKLQSENKFQLILELAEDANNFLLDHPEEAIIKKPSLKVISDRVNQSGAGQVADSYLDATFEFLEDLGQFNMY